MTFQAGPLLSRYESEDAGLRRALAGYYAGDQSLLRENLALQRRVLREYVARFGGEAPVTLFRAPARINLMGMHIDHRGGAINPIAIKELCVAARPRDDDLVRIANLAPEFPERAFRLRDALPTAKIADWDAWTAENWKTLRAGDWANYVRAATLYLENLHRAPDGSGGLPVKGFEAVFGSTAPIAAGLSSSSAIVVAVMEIIICFNKLQVDQQQYVDHCGLAEWYVGTRGGMGDHGAIKFGRAGYVTHMKFFPFRLENIPLPRQYKVVLVNSRIKAEKAHGARDAYNNRIGSYEVGLLYLRQRFPQFAPRLKHLRDANPKNLNCHETTLYHLLKCLPERAFRPRIRAELPAEQEELDRIFRSHTEPAGGYTIRQVCAYGITECLRSEMAAARLADGDVAGFGELMNLSQDGDRVRKRGGAEPADNHLPDALLERYLAEGFPLWKVPGGYDASTPEVDRIADLALSVPGTVGARMVGAGMGGCVACLCHEAAAATLIRRLVAEYYEPLGLEPGLEVVAPVDGACRLALD